MTPLVSIAMTAHNAERWLEQAIVSVLSSSMPDLELLFYDDGSSDTTRQCILDWSSRDRRCRLVGIERVGRARALKHTLECGVGRYVGWVDADDMLNAKALETCIDAMRPMGAELCFTGMTKIAPGGHEIQRITARPSKPGLPATNTHFSVIGADLYKHVNGVDTSFECAMDFDLLLRCALASTGTVLLGQSLYDYRQHPNSISRRKRFEQRECAIRALNNAMRSARQ